LFGIVSGRPLGLFFRGLGLIRLLARLPRHLPHQPLDAARQQETRRRLGLRVVRGDHAAEGDQAGDLVLLVLRVVDAGAGGGGAGADAPAIDLDRHHLRRGRHPHRQLVAVLARLAVPLLDQFAADLLRQGAHVLRGDGQAGLGQGEGGVGERPQARRQVDDQAQGGGGVAVVIQAQQRPLGGKSLAGRRGSGRPARCG
jgi:hypothetical protein